MVDGGYGDSYDGGGDGYHGDYDGGVEWCS